jgi:hypothetical protein
MRGTRQQIDYGEPARAMRLVSERTEVSMYKRFFSFFFLSDGALGVEPAV